jgi:hypothetical protein
MSKKRKKGMGKKAQRRQMAKDIKNAFDPSLSVAAYISRTNPALGATDADMHKVIKDYFLAHPTKNSTTVSEIIEYLFANAKFTLHSPKIDSQNESQNALTSSPATSEANETNNLEESSVESKALDSSPDIKASSPPPLGERILLLVLSKEDRVNIPGDLEEEFAQIASKHGERYARLWYYKQVAASAWPLTRKAVGWGILAWFGEWIRRII